MEEPAWRIVANVCYGRKCFGRAYVATIVDTWLALLPTVKRRGGVKPRGGVLHKTGVLHKHQAGISQNNPPFFAVSIFCDHVVL